MQLYNNVNFYSGLFVLVTCIVATTVGADKDSSSMDYYDEDTSVSKLIYSVISKYSKHSSRCRRLGVVKRKRKILKTKRKKSKNWGKLNPCAGAI